MTNILTFLRVLQQGGRPPAVPAGAKRGRVRWSCLRGDAPFRTVLTVANVRDEIHPTLKPPADPVPPGARPTPAPAWVALAAAWAGLLMLAASVVFVFLPGSRSPVEELEGLRPYSVADRFLPVPIYGIAVALFLGAVVLWQMRKEPRPLPEAMRAQRAQAWTGIALALAGAVVIYTWVALRGPGAS